MPDVSSSQRILSKAYADSMREKPAAKPVPMTGNSMGKGMTNKGMRSGTVLYKDATDEEYMGYGFDVAVRKGVDVARTEFAKRIANLEEGKKKALMARFETKIASQKSLRKDTGLGAGMEKSYRDAAKTKTPMSLDYATRARNADAVKKLPSKIGKFLAEPFTRTESQIDF